MSEERRDSFQLTMMLLLCGVAVAGIVPFAVIRLLQGNLLLAAANLGIAAAICGIAAYAWFSRAAAKAVLALALFYSTVTVVVPYAIGQEAIYWLYPAVIANYFLLPLRAAVAINGAIVLAMLPAGLVVMPGSELLSVLVTLCVVNLFALIFYHRTSRQRARLDVLASRDPLTAAGNRRSLDQELAVAIARWKRQRMPSSLILFDLDRFKAINDTFGHETGDRLLVRLTKLVEGRIRETDRLFRYGGEEFIVLVSDTRAEEAARLAEQLRELIRRDLGTGREAMTASFGCAELGDGETPDMWLRRADEALYRAKNAGRDRVEVAE